jgi:hypothetical protein
MCRLPPAEGEREEEESSEREMRKGEGREAYM